MTGRELSALSSEILLLQQERDKLKAELMEVTNDLRGYVEEAFKAVAHRCALFNAGVWWDDMCNSTARRLGTWLVDHGFWERLPGYSDDRQFYRKKAEIHDES